MDESDRPPTPPAGRSSSRGHGGATIHDVARAAGVSIGTVSKALNNSGTLRSETRDRVIFAARAMHFRPNDLAQALHRGQSFTVGLVSNDSFGRFTLPIMEGLESVLSERRIALFMCNATDDPEAERRHIEQLMSKRVDGLVFTARRADRRPELGIETDGLPKLFVFSQSPEPDSFCLLPDDENGARLAVEHLAGLGRRRIAHVTGPSAFEAVRLRRRGYAAALARAGLPERPEHFLSGAWSEQWGREAAARLFDGACEAPDAIFAGNDQIARGILDHLREQGIAVPRDVAVVGFDNWDVMVEATRPPITSIDMNLSELGRQAGSYIIRMIAGERFRGVERIPCRLVVRESCGAKLAATPGVSAAVARPTGARR
jgi:LacI family transcriptional regulator